MKEKLTHRNHYTDNNLLHEFTMVFTVAPVLILSMQLDQNFSAKFRMTVASRLNYYSEALVDWEAQQKIRFPILPEIETNKKLI